MPADDERAPGAAAAVNPLSADLRSAVFRAKLHPAVSPSYLLPRPRLHALLEVAVAAPLTLVVAPAGSGKTSLLRSWSAETALPVAWLSLDADDRDPVQLWRGVLAALEGVAPGSAASAVDGLQRPGQLLEAVGALLDDLGAREYDAKVLVIDDLHLVDEVDVVGSSLSLFVQHLPTWLHVVIASRRSPRLPVDRLRAGGHLGEVHFPELRFSHDEATAMLARLAPTLRPDVAAEVAARAGGWAASIQLAALAARSSEAQGERYLPRRFDERLHLEDYVWHEVLANEPEDMVDVLIATTVVQHIEPDLARILAGRVDAADLLTLAEQRGLFVSRTEPSGFEMHALVREVLLGVLAERSPDRLRQLHAWAAGWREAHGQTVSALEHWLRADRPRETLRLLAAQAPALYDGGHESTILRTVTALPDAVVADGIDAMLEYAWCHLLVDRRRFVALVEGLRRLVRDDLDVDPVLGARLEVLESIAATLQGHWVDGASLARSALESLGDSWWLDPLGQFAWNMIARDIALSERWDDSSHEVREVVRALSVVPERRLAFEGSRSLAEALAGRPADALRLVAGARQVEAHASMTVLRNEALTAEAVARRELGDVATAMPLLLEVCEGSVEPASHCQLLALLELTEARLAAGDLEAAERSFGRATEMVDTEMPGPGARTWLGRCGVSLSLAAGDVEGARAWSGQVVDTFWTGAVAARLHLATGDAGLAAVELKTVEPRCPRHRVVAALLQSRASVAPREAQEHLLEAAGVAASHGLVQTVAADGPEILDRIERLAGRVPQHWLDRLRRAGQPPAAHAETSGLVEELTERELEVLRMLPSRLTLREIADELFISINTLKFHLKVIYRKLGCTSRAEAAEVARALTSLRRRGQPSSTRRR
ncbi:LuxR C-terminal-related transcriptional regulator [Nocardioides sp. YIM 152315]|uniref:LuxR C-terminal-related transcriptional regulator n=1 Tax=Nocardioides sp. YIM 152315 TaxID=3031760 RepID=UPI0023DC06EA|nr:LuxR C-terminal-related transcriptional regulator [Nocardioides sp. YIM 152315]